MSAESKTQLKTYFQTGDIPTQAQFENLIDSYPNITDRQVPLYVYKAYLSQSGTDAPEAEVIVNTFPDEPLWSYSALGTYLCTLAGAFPEAQTHTMICGSEARAAGASLVLCTKLFGRNTIDDCFLMTGDAAGLKADGKLFGMAVTIEVYAEPVE